MLAMRFGFWWSSYFGGGPAVIWVRALAGAVPRVIGVTAEQARLVEITGEA